MENNRSSEPDGDPIDRQLADALDLYADGSPPPGLATMADRARKHESRIRRGVLAVAAAAVFAAGWAGDEWLTVAPDAVDGEARELVEANRDWDEQVELASLDGAGLDGAGLDGAGLDGIAPATLTELGLYLSRTERLRTASGVLQRMRYRSRDGRSVSIILKPQPQTDPARIHLGRHQGQGVAFLKHDRFSVGVIGDVEPGELRQVAERVRTHLDEAASRPVDMRRLAGDSPQHPIGAPAPATGDTVTVSGDPPPGG